jgi:AcrR family transcriptional regulator
VTDPADTSAARRPGRPSLLTREQVARAAYALVEAEGVGALTMARLARELGVGPMTLYGYAESKDAIVAMLADLLLEDLEPVDPGRAWAEVLEDVFLGIYRRFVSHGNVTQALTHTPTFGPAQTDIIEGVLDTLDRAGFTAEDAFELQRTLATYTFGFAIFAIAETQAGPASPRSAYAATHDTEHDPAGHPHLARASPLFGAAVDEQQYLRGLRRILHS